MPAHMPSHMPAHKSVHMSAHMSVWQIDRPKTERDRHAAAYNELLQARP